MSDVHDQLGPFLDGELTADEAAAFERHLASCAQCQKDLVDFGAISALAVAPPVAAAVPVKGKRPSLLRYLPLALAAVALVGVMGWLLTRPAPVEKLTLAQARPFEARLTWAAADVHRPFEPNRATAAQFENISATTLATLEKAGDTRALASAWLLSGNLARAKEVLATLPASADLESDLAAVALVEGDDEAALAHAQKALDANATHPQAQWNRALALERLGLVLTAAKAFHELEALGVPGWSAEAAARAKVLDASWTEGLDRSQRALDAGARMVLSSTPMSDELVRAMPAWARMNFRYALLTAPGEAEVRALAPTAAALDAVFGGTTCTATLQRLATLDARQRAAFASRFRGVVVDYYRALKATGRAPTLSEDVKGLGDATALVAEMRKAGARDYLLFAAPLGRQFATAWDDYVVAARADPDPWFGLAVDVELARRAGAEGNASEQERRLLEVLDAAQRERATLRILQATEQLTVLYTAQHRIVEADRVGREALRVARSQGDAAAAVRVLQSLGDAARFRNAVALSASILEERSLRTPEDCDARSYLYESIAAMAIVALEPAKARAALAQVPTDCGTPFSVVGVGVLADLQRLAPQPEDAARFDAAIAALRANEPGESEALLLDYFEGLAWIDASPAKGRARLEATLARAATLETADAIPAKVRAYARGTLRIAAGRANDWKEVFSLLDPAVTSNCALVVEVQDNRVVAALRTASGSYRGAAKVFDIGPSRPEGLRLEEIASVVTPLLPDAVGCEKLSVSAGYPLHGRAGWLPDELAWSYAGGGRGGAVGTGPGLVVHDVATPAALKLPRIASWAEAPRASDSELTGDAATPRRVLQAMKSASFIELHVHGQVNPAEAGTAGLVLAADEGGRFLLSAIELENTKTALEGSPVVVLGACRASSVAPFLHEPWSLPRAFLTAGARSVLAAPVDLPDGEARAFFVKVVARLRNGQDAATALRDERVQFLKEKPGASWVRSVLVFE